MARDTLLDAKNELIELIALNSDVRIAGLKVLGFEPAPGNMPKSGAVTVQTLGMSPEFYRFAIRVYVSAEEDVERAQVKLDEFVQVVDSSLSSGFGPSNWDFSANIELNAVVATSIVEAGRQDNL